MSSDRQFTDPYGLLGAPTERYAVVAHRLNEADAAAAAAALRDLGIAGMAVEVVPIGVADTLPHYVEIPGVQGESGEELGRVWPSELDGGNSNRIRALATLRRHGITTIGDMICVGRSSISDIRGIGEGTMADIDLIMAPHGWRNEPAGIEQVATQYDDLREVPARRVHPFLATTGVLSVADILALSEEQQQKLFTKQFRHQTLFDSALASDVMGRAQDFAHQFTTARVLLSAN